MAIKERLIKVSVFVVRNPAITEEEFHSHWSTHHSALASPFLKRLGCLKYTQFHTPSTSKALIATMGDPKNPARQYDGSAEFLVRDMELFEKVYTDPEWLGDIKTDEDYLFDRSVPAFITAGWEEVYIEDGEIVKL